MKAYLRSVFAGFFILAFIFIPLTFPGLAVQSWCTRSLFLKPVIIIQHQFFTNALQTVDFSSDTIGLNILLALLLLFAFIIVSILKQFKPGYECILPIFRSFSAWYLAFILLKYGFDKLTKSQFYLPEPNILYSNFGNLNKDTLYWSTMGLSHMFSIVTGLIEILTATLILIKRTRVVGFCLTIAVLVNIVLINFSFDISVKTFSVLLLLAAVFNVSPYLNNLYEFFIRQKPVQLIPASSIRVPGYINIVLGIALLTFVLFPYIKAGNYNDDKAGRPFLHGAYLVKSFRMGTDSLSSSDFPYTKIFIHRDSYIIFQQPDGQMTDYFFSIDPVNAKLTLQDYHGNSTRVEYNYNSRDQILQLRFDNNQKWIITAKALNWQALPALHDNLHYTIDEIK